MVNTVQYWIATEMELHTQPEAAPPVSTEHKRNDLLFRESQWEWLSPPLRNGSFFAQEKCCAEVLSLFQAVRPEVDGKSTSQPLTTPIVVAHHNITS